MKKNLSRGNLVRNQLFADTNELSGDKKTPTIHRLCWLDLSREVGGMIQVDDASALPRLVPLDELKQSVESGGLRVLDHDNWLPRVKGGVPTGSGIEKTSVQARSQSDRTKETCEKLKTLFDKYALELFDETARGAAISKIVGQARASKPFVYKWLRRYFQRGMTDAAFVSDHDKCGARGKERVLGKIKRGRPPSPANRTVGAPGINISVHIHAFLRQGWARFRLKKKMSIAGAHRETLNLYFATGYRHAAGQAVPILPPIDTLPTAGQFAYWGAKGRDKRTDRAAQASRRVYNLGHRSTTGSAREGVSGPGHLFQVDATGGRVHPVARSDPKIRIPKAVVYGVVDTYSQLVVGWVVALEHASYAVMSTALERAFTNKVEYCNRFGIEITEADFPDGIVCDAVLGDRGSELMGHQSDHATKALGFTFADTPPGRADWKAYIERQNGHMKQTLRDIPGASSGPKRRGEPDPAQDACLDLDQYETILIYHFLVFNHSHVVTNHPDEAHLLAEGLAPTPINFWNWGMANRSGAGRSFDSEHIRAALMPKADIPAKSDGLIFQGLAYTSSKLAAQGVFLRATGHKRGRYFIAYEPRDLSEIWLLDDCARLVERCPLSPKFKHFRGISLWELEAIRVAGTPLRIVAATRKLELECARDESKRRIVQSAQKAQAAIGGGKPVFDENVFRQEQAERRAEQAWTKSGTHDGDMGSQDTEREPEYIGPPDYDSELDQASGG